MEIWRVDNLELKFLVTNRYYPFETYYSSNQMQFSHATDSREKPHLSPYFRNCCESSQRSKAADMRWYMGFRDSERVGQENYIFPKVVYQVQNAPWNMVAARNLANLASFSLCRWIANESDFCPFAVYQGNLTHFLGCFWIFFVTDVLCCFFLPTF